MTIKLYQKYTNNLTGIVLCVGIRHMKCGKLYEMSFGEGY